MIKKIQEVLDDARGLWRFRWAGLTVAWVVFVLGLLGILAIPDAYEATSTVIVDTRTALSAATEGLTVEASPDAQIERLQQVLFSGPYLATIAERSGLVGPDASPGDLGVAVTKLRDGLVLNNRAFGRSGTSGTYTISFRDHDPQISASVVQALVDTFLEESQSGKGSGSEEAQQFLVGQVAEYEASLRQSEERLAEFQKKNVGMMPGAQGNYFARLQAEMDQLKTTESSQAVALRRRDELQRQLRGEVPLSAATGLAGPNGDIAGGGETAMRIREAQQRLDELLLRYTDKHPDVLALRATLRELEQRQAAEIESVRRGDAGAVARSGLSTNPLYQALQLQATQAGVEVAALQADIGDRQSRIASLRGLINTAPEVEAEYARLNRDYGVTKSQYDALVSQLGRAKLGGEAARTGIISFEVIEPPVAATEPVFPQRPLLALGALALSLVVGVLVAFLLNMRHPAFGNVRQLSKVTDIPILGVVSMTWIERYDARVRRQAMIMGVFGATLLAVLGAFLFQHQTLANSFHRWMS